MNQLGLASAISEDSFDPNNRVALADLLREDDEDNEHEANDASRHASGGGAGGVSVLRVEASDEEDDDEVLLIENRVQPPPPRLPPPLPQPAPPQPPPLVVQQQSNSRPSIVETLAAMRARASSAARVETPDVEEIDGNGGTAEASDTDEDYTEFKSKMPRLHSDLNIKSAAEAAEPSEANTADEEVCSICFEPWTNSGIHRLVCLKCGHLFGEGCIDRWIKSAPKCPQCNRPSKRSDIRRIYAKSIKVLDTAELDKALKDLETERTERKKAEIQACEIKLQFQMALDELSTVKKRYKELSDRSANMSTMSASTLTSVDYPSNTASASKDHHHANANANAYRSMNFNLEKLINISDASGCRVVSFSPRHQAILVSQPSNNNLFAGFGIKKINLLDMKLSQYIPIHTKLIRDMAVCSYQNDELLLTCGMDKALKLTNVATTRQIHSYQCSQPIWSCAFNVDNPIYFYAGLANGHVMMFDKRKIDTHVKILNDELSMGSPVVNLVYVPRDDQVPRNHSGLLVSQFDRVSFFQTALNSEEHKYNPLLVDSNIMSCSYEATSHHVLVSTRPSQKHQSVRHLVYELTNTETTNSLNHLQTFYGSHVQKILARSKLFCIDTHLFGCSPCEDSKTALVWDVSSSSICSKLANTADIIDVCPIRSQDNHFVCTLTDKQLRVFKKT